MKKNLNNIPVFEKEEDINVIVAEARRIALREVIKHFNTPRLRKRDESNESEEIKKESTRKNDIKKKEKDDNDPTARTTKRYFFKWDDIDFVLSNLYVPDVVTITEEKNLNGSIYCYCMDFDWNYMHELCAYQENLKAEKKKKKAEKGAKQVKKGTKSQKNRKDNITNDNEN